MQTWEIDGCGVIVSGQAGLPWQPMPAPLLSDCFARIATNRQKAHFKPRIRSEGSGGHPY
jgi:hypothetical protein